ncbi:MAG: class A beta-lactamase [Fimbriimonas sp.]
MLLAAVLAFPPSIDGTLLQARVRQLEAGLPQARLGVAVRDLATGAAWFYRGDERFPMQSVFKLPLGLVVLRAVERGQLDLQGTVHVHRKDLSVPMSVMNAEVGAKGRAYSVQRLLELAVGTSDNTAADVLMRRVGGPRAVTAELAGLDVTGVRVDRYERDMQRDATGLGAFRPAMTSEAGFMAALNAIPRARKVVAMRRYLSDPRDTATPRGMMKFLEGFHAARFLKPEGQRLLMRIATETGTGRNRLKAGLPRGTTLAHKTGTGREIEGRAGAVNDVGIATLPGGRKLIVVVFLAGAGGTEAGRERAIADVARAVVEAVR